METRSWLSDASFYSVSLALVGMDLGQIKAYCSFKGTVWIVISLCFLFFSPSVFHSASVTVFIGLSVHHPATVSARLKNLIQRVSTEYREHFNR